MRIELLLWEDQRDDLSYNIEQKYKEMEIYLKRQDMWQRDPGTQYEVGKEWRLPTGIFGYIKNEEHLSLENQKKRISVCYKKKNDSMWHDNLSLSSHFSQVETLLQRQVNKTGVFYGNEQQKCGPVS